MAKKNKKTNQDRLISMFNRPKVHNPEASVSTTVTMSGTNKAGKEVVIPTVYDGQHNHPMAAVQRYRNTGKHFGKFNSIEEMEQWQKQAHQRQEAELLMEMFGECDPELTILRDKLIQGR